MTLHNKNDYMMFASHGLTLLAGQPALFVSVRVFVSPSASLSPSLFSRRCTLPEANTTRPQSRNNIFIGFKLI